VIVACIRRKLLDSLCGRSAPESEFMFTDAKRAEVFYDRRKNPGLHPSMLTACEKCCDVVRQKIAEDEMAGGK
jgi:hypothetical protein